VDAGGTAARTGGRALGRALFLATALAGAAVDLGTKAWAFDFLGARIVTVYQRPDGTHTLVRPADPQQIAAEFPRAVDGRTVTVIPGCFDLRASMNTGAVFGILSGQTAWVMVFTCLALGMIAWILFKADPKRLGLHAAFGLICAGAIGNLWDRLHYAGVRDFIRWYAGGTGWEWPTFNVADAALVVGIGVILVLEWRAPKAAAGPALAGTAGA